MAETVYILCALTCMACAVLLLRGYRRSRARFLLWSSICFMRCRRTTSSCSPIWSFSQTSICSCSER